MYIFTHIDNDIEFKWIKNGLDVSHSSEFQPNLNWNFSNSLSPLRAYRYTHTHIIQPQLASVQYIVPVSEQTRASPMWWNACMRIVKVWVLHPVFSRCCCCCCCFFSSCNYQQNNCTSYISSYNLPMEFIANYLR